MTDKLSVDVWRSPSFIGRPIQLMAAYNIFDERRRARAVQRLTWRVSVEGQSNFQKNYTENLEMIVSPASLTSRAQIYGCSNSSRFNDRRLGSGFTLESNQIPDEPSINAFSNWRPELAESGYSSDRRADRGSDSIPWWEELSLALHQPPFSLTRDSKEALPPRVHVPGSRQAPGLRFPQHFRHFRDGS